MSATGGFFSHYQDFFNPLCTLEVGGITTILKITLITCVILGSHYVAVFSLCFLGGERMSLKAVIAEHAA